MDSGIHRIESLEMSKSITIKALKRELKGAVVERDGLGDRKPDDIVETSIDDALLPPALSDSGEEVLWTYSALTKTSGSHQNQPSKRKLGVAVSGLCFKTSQVGLVVESRAEKYLANSAKLSARRVNDTKGLVSTRQIKDEFFEEKQRVLSNERLKRSLDRIKDVGETIGVLGADGQLYYTPFEAERILTALKSNKVVRKENI